MELQKMWVTLALKAGEFNQGLDEAQRRAEGFAGGLRSRVGGGLSALQGIGTAAFLGVGAAAVGGFGMAMRTAIDMNASLEQSTMQFTTLMGDADKAQEHVASLFEFGAQTPFETGPIIAASKHLQVFGGSALNTMDNLTLVGDAAAAVGAPIDEVAFWIGRAYSAIQGGQPFGEAAMRLQELGLLTPEVRAQMEGLQAAGASGTEVWGTLTTSMGSFGGAMEMQAASWAGLTSTISDNLGMLAAQALAPFFDLAKEGLAALAGWLSSPEVQTGIQNIAAGIATLIQSMAQFVTEQVIPFVQEHGEMLKAILAALGVVILASLIPAVVSLIASMAPIILTVGAVVAAVALLKTAWDSNWGGIQDKVKAVVEFIRNLVEGFLAAVRGFWDEHGAAIRAAAEEAWGAIQAAVQLVVRVVSGLVENALAAIRGFWEAHGEAITKVAKQAWEIISTAIGDALELVKDVFGAFRLLFEGDWEGFMAKVQEIWEDIWTAVVHFLGGLWDMVLPLLVGFWESIKEWFTIEKWKELGNNIIQGVVDGINAVGQRILDVLGDWVKAAIDWAKSLLGISSPSTVFMEMGVNIGQGLIEGIEAQQGDVLATLEGLFDKMGKVAGVAGGFAQLFEQRNIDPLRAQLEQLDAQIQQHDDVVADLGERLGVDMNAPGAEWMLLRFATSEFSSTEQRAWAQTALSFLGERRDMLLEQAQVNEELIRQQERLAKLEEQRQQMAFLQQQLDLLKLVRDNGLDASILAGLELGINADPGGIMDAMTRAMQEMIRAAEAELEIHSPSRVFERIGEQTLAGLEMGLRDTAGIERALETGMERAMMPTAGGVGVQDNSRRTVVNGGVHNYWNGQSSAMAEMEVLLR